MALTSTLLPSAVREPGGLLQVYLFVAVLLTFFVFFSLLSNLTLMNFSELFFLFYTSLLLCTSSGACEGQKQMGAFFSV